MHEAILAELVKHLSAVSEPENKSLLRTYFWGPLDAGEQGWEKVQTREEGRMISGGEFRAVWSAISELMSASRRWLEGTTGLRTWSVLRNYLP